MKRIIVVGGGLSGLATAYYLKKHYKNTIEIEVYEKHDRIGGYARTKDGKEHSPRVILPGYKHFLSLCREIPEISSKMKRTSSKNIGFRVSVLSMIYIVLVLVLYSVIYIFRDIEDDNEGLMDILHPSLVDTDTYKFIRNQCSKLGESPEDLPLSKLYHLIWTLVQNPFDSFYTFTSDYNTCLFVPLKQKLIQNGVRILTKSVCTNIFFSEDGSKINCIEINNMLTIYGDIFVFALDVASLSLLFPQFKVLREKTYDGQMGIQIKFDRVVMDKQNKIKEAEYISFNTEWDIIIHRREFSWKGLNESYWSVCLPYVTKNYSTRLKKFIFECTKSEIKEEIFFQLSSYMDLDLQWIEKFDIWESWVFQNGKWYTNEPYFSQRKGTYKFRPSNNSINKNTYICGAISKTKYNSWYMEGAVESGVSIVSILNQDKDHV